MSGMAIALCHSRTTREPVKCRGERMTLLELPAQPLTRDCRCSFPPRPAECSLIHQKTRRSEQLKRWNYQDAVVPWTQYSMEAVPIVLDMLYRITDFTSLALSLQQLLAQIHFKNSTFLAHSQNFKCFGLYFCIRIHINIMEQYLTERPVHSNSC